MLVASSQLRAPRQKHRVPRAALQTASPHHAWLSSNSLECSSPTTHQAKQGRAPEERPLEGKSALQLPRREAQDRPGPPATARRSCKRCNLAARGSCAATPQTILNKMAALQTHSTRKPP